MIVVRVSVLSEIGGLLVFKGTWQCVRKLPKFLSEIYLPASVEWSSSLADIFGKHVRSSLTKLILSHIV